MSGVAAAVAAALLLVPAAGSAPQRMQVVAREFSFQLSRDRLPAGRAIIELDNMGQDPHNLRIRRIGDGRDTGTGVVLPSTQHELELKLAPGKYKLWCSIADHESRGMVATLVVGS